MFGNTVRPLPKSSRSAWSNFQYPFLQNNANSPSNSLPLSAQSFSGEKFFMQDFGPVLRLLETMIFFRTSAHSLEVFDFIPDAQRNRLRVSTATKRYLTELSLASCCMSAKSFDQISFSL